MGSAPAAGLADRAAQTDASKTAHAVNAVYARNAGDAAKARDACNAQGAASDSRAQQRQHAARYRHARDRDGASRDGNARACHSASSDGHARRRCARAGDGRARPSVDAAGHRDAFHGSHARGDGRCRYGLHHGQARFHHAPSSLDGAAIVPLARLNVRFLFGRLAAHRTAPSVERALSADQNQRASASSTEFDDASVQAMQPSGRTSIEIPSLVCACRTPVGNDRSEGEMKRPPPFSMRT